ncbi:MAG: heme-copper oxidase subunit III [Anaerolineae bacterium]
MSAVTTSHEEYRQQLSNNRLGLWLFFVSETFMFVGLLTSRFYLWGDVRPDLDQVLGVIVTTMLLVSSYFMNRAETLMAHGDQKGFLNSLLVTAALGVLFLAGVIGFEWQGHIRPTDGAFGAVLYGMTGMHALHVVSGVIFILIVWNNGRKGVYTAERHWGVQACAIWWHYVDLVWVFFYPALYLIGKPA